MAAELGSQKTMLKLPQPPRLPKLEFPPKPTEILKIGIRTLKDTLLTVKKEVRDLINELKR